MRIVFLITLFTFLQAQGTWIMSGRVHPELKWSTIKTDHYNIHYHQGIENIAVKGATIAEQIHDTLLEQMGMTTVPTIDIIFTAEDEVMNGYAMWTNQTFIWVDQNDVAIWLEDEKWLFTVVAHELQHIIFMNAVKTWLPEPWSMSLLGEVPGWFVEGLAEYMTERWRPHRADLSHKLHILKNNTNQMDPHHDGFSKLLYLTEKYGDDCIVEIVQYRNKLKLYNFGKAFKKATGVTVGQFNEDWRRTMNTYYYGYRSQKESIEEIGNTATLPLKNVKSFAISQDSMAIAMTGKEDKGQYDMSLYIAKRDTSKEDEEKTGFSFDFDFGKWFSKEEEDTTKKWQKPKYHKEEVDFGSIHGTLKWSPDGTKLAYAKYRYGKNESMIWDLRMYDMETEESNWLTDNMRAAHPAWTPDGQHIIFAAHHNSTSNLFKLNISDQQTEQLTSYSGEVSVLNPAVSPNGERVVYAYSGEDGNTDLYTLTFSSGEISRLTKSPAVDYLPVWSPDGTQIIYTSHEGSTPNLHILTLEHGENRQITDVGDAVWSQQWTPGDSTILASTLTDVDTFRVVMVDPKRTITTQPVNMRDQYFSWRDKPPAHPLQPIDYNSIPAMPEAKRYQFTKHFRHLTTIALPIPIPFAETAWMDALGKHIISANTGYLDMGMTSPMFGLGYTNAQHGPLWGMSYNFNQRFLFRNYDGSDSGLAEKMDGLTLWARHPFNLGNSMSSGHIISIGMFSGQREVRDLIDYIEEDGVVNYDSTIVHEMEYLPRPEGGQFTRINLDYTYLTKRPHKNNIILPANGHGIKLSTEYSAKNLMSDFNYGKLSFDSYANLGDGNGVLYARLKGSMLFGDPPAQDTLAFSRDEATYLPLMGVSEFFPENINLRGSSEVKMGDKLLFGTLEYRFKLMDGDLPVNILGITAGDLTAALISDFGNVWQNKDTAKPFNFTAGYEVKISFKSGGFPMMIYAWGRAGDIASIEDESDLKTYYRLALINPF